MKVPRKLLQKFSWRAKGRALAGLGAAPRNFKAATSSRGSKFVNANNEARARSAPHKKLILIKFQKLETLVLFKRPTDAPIVGEDEKIVLSYVLHPHGVRGELELFGIN